MTITHKPQAKCSPLNQRGTIERVLTACPYFSNEVHNVKTYVNSVIGFVGSFIVLMLGNGT